jgi:pimeloyl-ACP methyl ester carboxylesterase
MRRAWSAMAAMMLAVIPNLVQAAAADPDMIADAYAEAGELVRLADGRAMNLRCSGEGGTVVMLEAGGNADSTTWFRVLPAVARLTRVCAYDRAGHGFSDEGPQPRDLDADVADLHALMTAADIRLPAVLVGHSKGSNIVRKYAQMFPQQVAALVLVDPPEQGADGRMPEAWQAQTAAMVAQRDAFVDACENAAAAGDSGTMKRCLRAPPAWMGEQVAAAMQRNKSQPSYWRSLRSELAHNVAEFAAPVPADESYGSIPLVLLRAEGQAADAPDDVREVIESARRETHARILAASTHSIEIVVPGSSHDIQLDRPDAVVSAVRRLLDTNDGREPTADE